MERGMHGLVKVLATHVVWVDVGANKPQPVELVFGLKMTLSHVFWGEWGLVAFWPFFGAAAASSSSASSPPAFTSNQQHAGSNQHHHH